MTRRFVLAAALLLGGCATWFGVLDRDRLLGGYELMSLPASDVPVGARWRQGVGPVGPAALAQSIEVQRGLSTLSLDRSAERGLELKLADWAGLTPSGSAKLAISVQEISIYRVTDFAGLNLKPGEMVVSDAMKASRITITVDRAVRDKVAATLRARGLEVDASVSGAGAETLAVEGADLFFAYRVMRVEAVAHDGGAPRLERVKDPRAPGW